MAGASSDYVINVSSTFEGEQTITQLNTLTAKLVSGGTGADVFHDAIAKVTNQLTAAKSATLAANAALAEGSAHYATLEKAASEASKAFEKAQKTGVVPPGVEASFTAATAAVNDQAKALKQLEAAAKAAEVTEGKLNTTLKNAKDISVHTEAQIKAQSAAVTKAETAERSHERQLKKTAGALNSVGGPLGTIGAKVLNAADDFGDMSESMGATNAAAVFASAGLASVAVAVVAITVVLAAAVIGMAAWAISLADSSREADLNLQALTALDSKYSAVSGSLEDLTYDTGQTQTALLGLTKKLIDAKVSAKDLPEALRAAALAETALGAGGADTFITDIQTAKTSVDKFAATAEAKFGGIVQKRMLGLTAQSARFHNNIGNLFGGLNIEPVLVGLQKLVALFDDSTAAGQAIKLIFEGVFQPLINSVDKAATVVEAFVLGVLIGFVKLYIALKPTIKALGEFFGFNDPATADSMAQITAVGEKLAPVLAVLAALFGVIAAVVGVALAAALVIAIAPLAIIATMVYATIEAFMALKDVWNTVTTFLGSISLVDVGKSMLEGLVQGILGAGPAVLHALGGIVTGAIDGAKDLLGIHSPSKVFAEIGHNTGAGMVQGLDGSAGDVQESMASVVEPPTAATGSAPQASAGKGSTTGAGKSAPDLSGAVFNFYGVKDAADAKESFGDMLTAFLEGDAARLGNARTA